MNYRTILFASLFGMLALNPESVSMLSAAEKNAREPGPTDGDAPKDFTTTKSGLKYRILRKSDGEKPLRNDKVFVNYKGWLDDGEEFDSSYKKGRTIDFKVNQVIPGWTEGMQLIGVGGMIELEIPSKIGYGKDGFPGAVPPDATLHFIVELVELKRGPKPVEPGKADADAPEEFTTTKSGLKYRIRRNSDGKKPSATSVVSAHYKGWLDDGSVFDASYDRGEVLTMPLNRLIRGWAEGMQLIGKGGMIEMEVPPEIGYGKDGFPPVIPPNATLHFLVELIDVK